MTLSAWQEIHLAFHYAFRTLVPLPHHRAPWAWNNAHWAFIPYIPVLFMSYLVRRRDTFAMRLLLLPVTICLLVYSAYGFYWPQPWLQSCNWAQSLMCGQLMSKVLEYALTPVGRLKVGETKLPPIGGEKDTHPPSSPTAKHRAARFSFVPTAVNDAVELFFVYRGYGWDIGEGVHAPPEYRPLERGAFLKEVWKMLFKSFLLLDFVDSCLKLVPGLTLPFGGSIFLPLPPVQRYIVSTILHITTGIAFMAGFEMVYAISTLVGVGILHQSPLLWPPFLDHPFSSESLSEFWAKRWHQVLRRVFVVFGGYPAFWLGSWVSTDVAKASMLFGVFIASGLFHELTTYTMGGGFDNNIAFFFLWHAFAVLGERLWYKVTGRRVRGWIGLLWVYFCIMILGQPCVDAWYYRGIGGSVVISTAVSPTRKLLWPILRRLHPIFEFLP